MRLFKKSKSVEAQDKGIDIMVKIDMPTKGMTEEEINAEFQRKASPFVREALSTDLIGLRHENTVLSSTGHGIVTFDIPSAKLGIEIARELGDLWLRKYSG